MGHSVLIAIIRKAMVQIIERVLSTKELVVQMTTAFFSPVSIVYFAKIATGLALSNGPDFHLFKYVKMSKWPKIA